MEISVSVIIPVYNAARYIAATIESALRQTLPPAEIIVVDDGSTDQTAAIVRQLAENHPCIKLIQQANAGVAAARNAAIHHASGTYFAFLDADDVWLPSFLATMLPHAAPLRLLFSDFATIDESSVIIQPRRHIRNAQIKLPQLLIGNQLLPSTVVISRQLWQITGEFDESLPVVEDWDWFLRVLLAGGELRHIPQVLCHYRLHNASLTKRVDLMVATSLRVLDKTFARANLPPFLQRYRARAYFINFGLAAGKFYGINDFAHAHYYLNEAERAASSEFYSLQTFISFLKIYAQTANADLLASGENAVQWLADNAATQANKALLSGLGYLTLALLLARRAPGKSLRLLATALKIYPALLLRAGVYRPLLNYGRVYGVEFFSQWRRLANSWR